MSKDKSLSEITRALHNGRDPEYHFGAVNTPVYRASTILFNDFNAFKNADWAGKRSWKEGGLTYGRRNTPITLQLAETICDIEGGDKTFLTCSGVAAISVTMAAFLSPGDHVFISDSVYTPTKMWAEKYGKKMGIYFSYIPNDITKEELEAIFTDKVKLVMLEAPGSLSFEIADIPMISDIAHKHNAVVAIDNTWSAGVHYKAFEKGCDISIQAGTKYYTGHSDACFGSITCKSEFAEQINQTHAIMGQSVDADTAFLALRGIRTLHIRLKQHQESALEIANFLEGRNEIQSVLFPALPSSPDYILWKRDFTGACGLFSFILKDGSEEKVEKFVNNLKLFGIGFSWGGFESLIMPCLADNLIRNHEGNIKKNEYAIRIHIGLEDVNDLKEDLIKAFEAIA